MKKAILKGLFYCFTFTLLASGCKEVLRPVLKRMEPQPIDGIYDADVINHDGRQAHLNFIVDRGYASYKEGSGLRPFHYKVNYVQEDSIILYQPFYPSASLHITIKQATDYPNSYLVSLNGQTIFTSFDSIHFMKKPVEDTSLKLPEFITITDTEYPCKDDYLLGTWLTEHNDIFHFSKHGYRTNIWSTEYYTDSMLLYKTEAEEHDGKILKPGILNPTVSSFYYLSCDTVLIVEELPYNYKMVIDKKSNDRFTATIIEMNFKPVEINFQRIQNLNIHNYPHERIILNMDSLPELKPL